MSEEFDRPVMVHRYPSAVKAFYMKPDPDRPDVALGVDVLAPEGYGEIIGGGERLDDYELLLQRIKDHNLPQEAFEWYLDLRRFGSVPHGGFGMGIERVVSWICGTRPPARGHSLSADALQDLSVKIGFLSLGCPKNLVDGEVMLGIAREAGHEITQDAAAADVLVVNTCAFIDNAKEESINAILEMAALEDSGHDKRLVVTGCLAERYRDELRKEIPEIDAVLGTGEVPHILEAIGTAGPRSAGPLVRKACTSCASAGDQRALPFYTKALNPEIGPRTPDPRTADKAKPPDYIYDADTPRLLTTPKHFAYVKIAEGCDYTCAFCIIPTLRGSYRSRTVDSIVREARALAERGVRELLLISQDTSFYGIDRGERGAAGPAASAS